MTQAIRRQKFISVTPTVDTNIYASGDQLGSLMTLTDALKTFSCGELLTLTIVDKAKQASALSVLLFSASPTVASSDNGALDISDAEMVAKCIGHIPVATTDWKTLNANSVACVKLLGFDVWSAGDSLYAIMMSAGTPTYTSASDLTLKFSFRVG